MILYQFLRYGKDSFAGTMLTRWVYPIFVVVLAGSYLAVLSISFEFNDLNGKYAAFAQNLMMSILFIAMLLRRNNASGQSIYIAIFKMIGSIIPSILFYSRAPQLPFSLFLYVTIFLADLLYSVMLYVKTKESGQNPWRRF